jgi:hypothetical protein
MFQLLLFVILCTFFKENTFNKEPNPNFPMEGEILIICVDQNGWWTGWAESWEAQLAKPTYQLWSEGLAPACGVSILGHSIHQSGRRSKFTSCSSSSYKQRWKSFLLHLETWPVANKVSRPKLYHINWKYILESEFLSWCTTQYKDYMDNVYTVDGIMTLLVGLEFNTQLLLPGWSTLNSSCENLGTEMICLYSKNLFSDIWHCSVSQSLSNLMPFFFFFAFSSWENENSCCSVVCHHWS